MGKTIALKEELQTLRHELSPEDLVRQAQKIMEIKERVMREGVHYGIIPGCKKPSLLKPGAEKLCSAFRLEPEFETSSREDINRDISWEKWDHTGKKKIKGTTKGFVEYDSNCTLIHIPTGEVWAKNVSGSCNSFEAKYRKLNPYDLKNTLEKMAEKRALVAAVLVGTAASDQFTQDIEAMPFLVEADSQDQEEEAEEPSPASTPEPAEDNSSVRLATPKQVAYIKSQIKKQNISQEDFFATWAEECENWDEIPFHKVNSILAWIREM